MYIEIHNYEDIKQEALYYKLNNALSIDSDDGLNKKVRGIYAIYNKNVCLYVGQSKNIASRIATHLRGKYKKATEIYIWDVEEIGFDDFNDRNKDAQKGILDNCEKYLMSKLKPVDNLLINMDINVLEDFQPNICFESSSDITFSIQTEALIITNTYSYTVENISSSLDYLDYQKQIDKKTFKKIKNIIVECEQKGFRELGVKNEE